MESTATVASRFEIEAMSVEPLEFPALDPEDNDPFKNALYSILRDALQSRPGPQVSLDVTVTQLTELLPKNDFYSTELSRFFSTCFNVAEQLPYNHSSMPKLVDIIEMCMASFPSMEDSNDIHIGSRFRYQMFQERLRDNWEYMFQPDEYPAEFINASAFMACVHERGLVGVEIYAIWTLEDAFENFRGLVNTRAGQDACIEAALRYLLVAGEAIHESIGDDGKPEKWRYWHEKIDQIVSSEDPANKQRIGWRHWLDHLLGRRTADEANDSNPRTYSPKIVTLAHEALIAMEAVDLCKPLKAG